MKLIFLEDSGAKDIYEITKESLYKPELKNKTGHLVFENKKESILSILKSYNSGAKLVLFDKSNFRIQKNLDELGLGTFDSQNSDRDFFGIGDYSLLFFTSGTTGNSIGAFKTKENIDSEINVLEQLLIKYNLNRVIVTVPFVHLYGALFGLFLPVKMNIDIIAKEQFYPQELIDFIEPETLIITTPVYIKALSQLSESKSLNQCVFVSSTAPLDPKIRSEFIDKFQTNLVQIYGSTETGGIGYKFQNDEFWTPFPGVDISTNEDNLLTVESPFVSPYLWNRELVKTNGKLSTFDYIEIQEKRFKLVGRNSQIFKVAGKRYSTIEMENILESVSGIEKALVKINQSSENLRGETLEIYLETKMSFTTREIKDILSKQLSNIKFSIELKIVDKIPVSPTGKKILKLDIN